MSVRRNVFVDTLPLPCSLLSCERRNSMHAQNHDGTGRVSAYGQPFGDENFILRHAGPGVLTCCNSGPDTNTSTFMITTVEVTHFYVRHTSDTLTDTDFGKAAQLSTLTWVCAEA